MQVAAKIGESQFFSDEICLHTMNQRESNMQSSRETISYCSNMPLVLQRLTFEHSFQHSFDTSQYNDSVGHGCEAIRVISIFVITLSVMRSG